ncbi:hypothetical protein [Actinomadura rupiterrae]|uniref:hypothetical protein n=1 Tax=Actinomadura rupiterrae TaxID=559627 RepID=UPI0020A3BE9D|nr:hypothetical protein [Actinomadura rupiterrae]MCP2338908.1 MinD-like ATPase involved in chromosome partitioning or flagellar assembly [Actinomadura rupiterrae]
MAVLTIGSVKGSPGVTTLLTALAATWPTRPVVLVEADPAGGDLAAQWELGTEPGLVGLAAAARRAPRPDLFWSHGQRVGEVTVVPAPVGAGQASAAVAALAASGLIAALAGDPRPVVLVDVGRVTPESAALGLVAQSTAMLVMARAQMPGLAHLSKQFTAVTRTARQAGVVLVGAGAFPVREVEAALHVPVIAQLPEDRRGAAVLASGPSVLRRAGRVRLAAPRGHWPNAWRSPTVSSTPTSRAPHPPAARMRRAQPAMRQRRTRRQGRAVRWRRRGRRPARPRRGWRRGRWRRSAPPW